MILLANSTLKGTFYFSQAPKVVDIPHRKEKKDLFWGIFPHFLNSPTISLSGGVLINEFDFEVKAVRLSYASKEMTTDV